MMKQDIARRLYSVAQVRELDRRAMASGIAGYQLMQRAAAASWQALQDRWPDAQHVHVICGSGNNGGDGFEIARLALAAKRNVQISLVGKAPESGDALTAYKAWQIVGGSVGAFNAAKMSHADVIVDAIFGIGLSREVTGVPHAAILAINAAHQAGTGVLAVDVPSGLDADRGSAWGAQVHADMTVTFIADKPGLHVGNVGVGQVRIADLDIPESVHEGLAAPIQRLHETDLQQWLPPRAAGVHKGNHGHVLLMGGNHGMAGAILLAARAALRAGAGLVSVATRQQHTIALTAAQPELMCHAVEEVSALLPLMTRADVIAIGPGLGQDDWSRSVFAAAMKSEVPLVVDADALNLLAEVPTRYEQWILTPHPGEAARLLSCSTSEIQRNRFDAALRLQQRYGGVAVLKGAGSLTQGVSQRLCPYGNPGMAVGGMGDVLTGIIAAFVAQGLSLENAANAGVVAHALAGDRAAATGQRGLLPSDVIDVLRSVVNP